MAINSTSLQFLQLCIAPWQHQASIRQHNEEIFPFPLPHGKTIELAGGEGAQRGYVVLVDIYRVRTGQGLIIDWYRYRSYHLPLTVHNQQSL